MPEGTVTQSVCMDATQPESANVRSIVEAVAHDEPYRFGRRPSVCAPFPFTERQLARLFIIRSRLDAAASTADQAEAA
jgi:hypothetical protein